MTVPPVVRGAEAPPEADLEVRRYRVISGCVECASDLTPLRRIDGVRDVRLLSATGTLAIETSSALDDAVLLRVAGASGFTLEPEHGISETGESRKKTHWWTRPEMVLLAIAAVFLVISEVSYFILHLDTIAVVAAIVTLAAGLIYPVRNAWTMARNKRFSINVLLIVAVIGAIPLGKIVEAACVTVIFSLGMVLESYVADRARKSIQKLMDLSPPRAERFVADGSTELVPVEQLRIGDVVLVRPGSRLPTDGTVTQGASWIDASAITGESMPVEVAPDETVYGGTLNGHSALRVRVDKAFTDTVLARVIREVEEAQQNKGTAQRFADKFAGIYTPVMIAIAIAMAVLGPVVLGLTFEDSLYRALVVLIVSCSCSLVLSVPAAVVAAVARAARDGVLIKGGAYLEDLAKLKAVAFDKTGTLTLGRPLLVEVHPLRGTDENELLRLTAAVEAAATHPIAEAIVRAARERGFAVRPAEDVRVIAGVGAQATVDGKVIAVGRVTDLGADKAAQDALAAIEAAGATPVVVSADGRMIGLLGVADELRPDAVTAIEQLRGLGITHTTMLTGDRQRVADAIAQRLGITNVRAQLMPEDKSAAIKSIKAEVGTVAMVGDGVNDAPALATADVAVVMGAAGTDVALETADVALMADDLTKLPYAVSLARRSRRIISQNVVVSLVVIVLLVLAALTGRFNLTRGVLINEVFALVIIANGLRLLRGRKTEQAVLPTSTTPTAVVPAPVLLSIEVKDDGCGSDCGCGTDAATEDKPSAAAPVIQSDCGCGPTGADQGVGAGHVHRH